MQHRGHQRDRDRDRDRNTGLSHYDQEMLIKSFPNEIKFSYEKSTHKKVLSDLYTIIPKGRKYFVWFTHYNRKNICLFLEICNRTHNIMNIFYICETIYLFKLSPFKFQNRK